jgi:predicted methyltransferase
MFARRSLFVPLLAVVIGVGAAVPRSGAATPAAATPVTITAEIAAAVASPARSDKDRERDAREKPAQIMAFAGVKPGMAIADVLGGGGYYSELFAHVVGPSGKVSLVNNMPYLQFARDGLKARFTEGRLTNVERRVVEAGYMQLGEKQYDLAVIVMSYHDLYHVDEKDGWPAIEAARFLEQLQRALKPGGHLLIIDHAAQAGSGASAAQDLHRIDEQFAIKDISRHGFVLAKSWDGLRNPGDDFGKSVFDAAVRGKTDRFVHLYRRSDSHR